MLTFTDAQMAALDAAAEAEFAAAQARALVAEFPEEFGGLRPEIVARMVATGIARARAAGFETRKGLALWLRWMAGVAPGFDRHPEFARRLALKVPERTRIALLDAAPDAAVEEAAAAYDIVDWFRPPGAPDDWARAAPDAADARGTRKDGTDEDGTDEGGA